MMHRLLILLSIVSLGSANIVLAQDYDDIYYDSSKEEKKAKTIIEETDLSDNNSGMTYSPYIVEERDVDEYNRRGNYYSYDSDSTNYYYDTDSIVSNEEDFEYTERIKRFHNPTVVIESSDEDLVDLYVYTRPSVNIVVGTPSYYSPWTTSYYSSWTWGYDPWLWDSWYYDPYYYYSSWYRPIWYSSWYPIVPHWGWGCAPYYHHHHHTPLYTSWHNPVHRNGNIGGRRPVGSVRNNNGVRPNGTTRYTNNNTRSGQRIGNIVSRRPGNVTTRSTTNNSSYSGNRGGNVRFGSGSGTTSTTRSSSSRWNSSSNSRSSSTNFDNNSNSVRRSSSSFTGSGSGRSSSAGTRMGGSSGGGGARGGGHRR